MAVADFLDVLRKVAEIVPLASRHESVMIRLYEPSCSQKEKP
jgi:hypothetical protein